MCKLLHSLILCCFYSSLKLLLSKCPNEKWLEKRVPTEIQILPKPPQKSSSSVAADPASLSIWTRHSVRWKLSWHFPPLLLPLGAWVRLPRELLWWLIDFNHITRLRKSRQRMKVQGNTTTWNPQACLNIYTNSNMNDGRALKGTSLKQHVRFIAGRTTRWTGTADENSHQLSTKEELFVDWGLFHKH